ncbi:hypothetical protein N0V93_004522 [Gnomoniopsis smithogilvyi]|uniref:Oxidoreductase n=1 Tax=Gnomoniopsis smithogilvyi TaxID=1191159 RepID=A0A9W8YT08_9PEZI|nr:hypothetical protein N0V93_004522 [Gnomoniopsis smithogilvyi]
MFNVGVIGYGLSAKIFHIPFIKATPSLNLYSICQRSPTPDSSASLDHPEIQHHTSIDSFLVDTSLDVVVLSTPPSTHFALTSQALAAGKHVLVEKPFVPTSAQADQLIDLARKHGRLLCIYQNRRWDADFLTVQKLLSDDTTLGRVVEFETHYDRYRAEKSTTWKGTLSMDEGGGVIYDLGSHLLDQVYVLFGMPKSVFAKFVSQRDGLHAMIKGGESVDPDSVTVLLSYDGGLLVHVRIGVLSAEVRQPRFWIRGTKGSYFKTDMDPQEEQLRGGMTIDDPQFGRSTNPSVGSGKLTRYEPDGKFVETRHENVEPQTYKKIYELFAEALKTGKESDVPVHPTQARDVLRIIEAARKSGRTGAEVPLI